MHETRFLVRPTQVDVFGHMNNAAYLELFEWARWEWALAEGIDFVEMARAERVGPAVAHVDLSFRREVRMHEQVTVRTWFERIERQRAIFGQEMIKPDGRLAASLWLTFVFMDLDRRRAAPLHPMMLRAYEADAPYRESRAGGAAPCAEG